MAQKKGLIYLVYALPLIVGGVLVYSYLQKNKKLKKKFSGGGEGFGEGEGTQPEKEIVLTAGGFTNVRWVKTSGTNLNVRKQPSTTSDKISSIANKTKVFTKSVGVSGWVGVSLDGNNPLGFASASFLSATDPASSISGGGTTGGGFSPSSWGKYVVKTSGTTLNVRTSPDGSASIIDKLANGSTIYARQSTNPSWLEVSKDGKTSLGYSSKTYLQVSL
jgi:uncharacterized protein YgiM (DUF1202 family)